MLHSADLIIPNTQFVFFFWAAPYCHCFHKPAYHNAHIFLCVINDQTMVYHFTCESQTVFSSVHHALLSSADFICHFITHILRFMEFCISLQSALILTNLNDLVSSANSVTSLPPFPGYFWTCWQVQTPAPAPEKLHWSPPCTARTDCSLLTPVFYFLTEYFSFWLWSYLIHHACSKPSAKGFWKE